MMTQHYDLKAIFINVLERNRLRNTSATTPENLMQQRPAELQQLLHDSEPVNLKFEYVTCESCKHIIPSVLNPGEGWGRCTVSEKHGDYPRRRHICHDHEPVEPPPQRPLPPPPQPRNHP